MAAEKTRMVDIHTHVLPGLDDGAQEWEDSLAMAEMAAESGVAAVVATPHCGLPGQELSGRADRIHRLGEQFRQRLAERGTPLTLCDGMEIFGTPETPRLLKQGLLLTLNESRYPLIEFPFEDYGMEATRILEQVRDLGYVPVVAHPERYLYVQETPELLNLWTDLGCLLQVNRGSLLGRFSRTAEELAWAMVDRGFVCTVASDGHSPFARTTWMRDVYVALRQDYSAEFASQLLEKRPLALLMDKAVSMDPPDWF